MDRCIWHKAETNNGLFEHGNDPPGSIKYVDFLTS
jgi:hypothetical protein